MQFKLADAHTDILSGRLDVFEIKKYYLRNSFVTPCLAIYCNHLQRPNAQLKKYDDLISQFSFPHRLAFENIHYANEQNLPEIIARKPLYCSLTWNDDNDLAGGAYGDGGLTRRGKLIAERLSGSSVYIDTAHLNRKSFYKLLDVENVKIINSHTCFDAVNAHLRNIDSYQITEIVQRGGIVGLTFVSEFIAQKKRANLNDVCAHISFFVDRFGCDHLCLGTDFFGTDHLPIKLKNYKMCLNLVEKLFKIGYNDTVIKKIFNDNLISFMGF